MNIAGATSFEGFICPACFVDFPGAAKLKDHWVKFHSPNGSAVLSGRGSNDYEEIPEDLPPSGYSQINSAGTQLCNHVFRSDLLAVLEKCGICGNVIEDEGRMCQGCNFCCHKKCEGMVKGQGFRIASVNSTHSKYKSMADDELGRKSRAPPSPRNLVTNICHHMRHRVSRNRVRHVDEHFDLDLTYITDRIIAMSFPGSGLETTYRNNLREVARMLQTNHQDKYMVFNLSERRYDISKLNHQVLDFGWPDHFAPPLERLCSIIKSIDSWLKTDKQHVVVVHCKGGKGRTGVVIAAYMHFSKICSSPKEALDWFAMKRFYDDSLGGVTQPSQRRYVHYFSDYLDGKIKLNTDPIFLHHVIIHGIPSFDAKDGCKPFLRVYDGLKLIYTSGVFHVTSDMERICITIEGGLILHGDILIKCYHKNTLSSGRDVIFRCQFHTGAVKDRGLVLDKTELDDACKDKRFPDSCKVEFVFSTTGNLISEIKDDERLQSIIKRHSLQPVENPDTVLYPSLESWYDSSGSIPPSPAPERRATEQDFKKSDYADKDNEGSAINEEPSATLKRPPEYVAGPVNGHLYAQVDKAFKKKVRSLSLDSGVRTKSGEELGFFENRANTLNRRKAYGFENKENEPSRLKHPELQYTVDRMQQSNSVAVSDEITHKIKSIDKLLQELGECTDLLDSTLQQPKPNVKNIDTRGTNFTAAASGKSPPGPPKRKAASFDAGERYLNRMIAGSVRTNEPHPQNGIGSLRRTSPRGTNFGSASSRSPLPLQPLSPTDASSNSLRADCVPNDILSAPKKGEQIQVTTTCILHDAPIPQASPPMSPKFYATQMTPRTFKASTYAETVEYNSNHPGQKRTLNNSSSFTYGGLGSASDAFVSNGKFVDGNSAPDDWKFASRATSNDGPSFDFNNNKSATNLDLRDFEEQKIIEDSHTLPEKGNVASKIALLTDMFQPDKLHPPPHQTVKGTLVPMPGLTSVSPSEVFKEIASYNAKSLAPGELSHSSGTLYITGAPPTKIVEQTRRVRQEFDKDELQQSRLPPTHAFVLPKTDFSDRIIDKSPSSSVDGLSLDEGVESKGSTDETTTLGMSPSASSDGHTDSAFGESIFSSSSVSTPIRLSNRFNPAASATANQDVEIVEGMLSQSDSDLLEQAAAYVHGAREDDEAGYARLEDVREAKASGRQASGISTETQTTLEGTSPLDTPRGGVSMEEIKPDHVNDDVEAINDILTEIADMSTLDVPEPSQLSRSSTPQSFNSGGTGLTPRSPVFSSGSGSFENASERTKSHPHSDKGYGSTTSVSTSSSGDNVFLPDSPKIPGLKFDRDTSSFWYKPVITRDDAIALLRNKDPGSFIIRDSQSFPGAFGLAVKVAVPPAHVLQGLQGDMTKFNLDNELVRHFLIESTKRGVRLKGCSEEPAFGSLAAFVYQHSITPLALPIRLSMPSKDPFQADKAQSVEKEDDQSWPRGAVGSLMYLGLSDVEMLTGTSAIQRTIENLSTEEAAKKFTTVSFKVSPQGMTVTDNERKVFFRQHFPMQSILHCGIDPGDKRWELKTPTYSGKSKSFGIVLRKTGGVHNECHLFGEISKDWPSSILVNIVNRFMTPAT